MENSLSARISHTPFNEHPGFYLINMTGDVINRHVFYERRERKENSEMRKVTFGGANSLDNYIARKDDSFDWIMHGKEAAEYLKDYWKTIDTVLMGRKTYEVALKMSKGQSNPYPGVKSYVFSRTLKESGDK